MTVLPVIYAVCPACGHQAGTQKPSGLKIRCPRCYQDRGKDVYITVPERDGNTTRPAPIAARPEKTAAAAVTARAEPEPGPSIGKRIRAALGASGSRYPRPASRGDRVARGVYETTCTDCGLAVWRARLSPEAQARAGYRSSGVMLEPRRADGEHGGVLIGGDGLAVFTGRYPGEYMKHNCPAKVSRCKYCSQSIRVLNQPPGSPERLAVLDADEDGGSAVAIDERGYAVHDPDHQIEGPRYRWHVRHDPADRGAAVNFGHLMTRRPGGSGR